jgi:hypothetical protein
MLIVAFAVAALYAPAVRWVTSVLAVWLALSTFARPTWRAPGMANDFDVALLVFLASIPQDRPPDDRADLSGRAARKRRARPTRRGGLAMRQDGLQGPTVIGVVPQPALLASPAVPSAT